MTDFTQVNPQNLEQIFSQNPGVWGMAQDYMNRANQGNDLTQQHQELQNQWEKDSQPFRLSGLGLGNDTMAAQLPGVKAQSAMLGRKNDIESLMQPQMIQEMKGKYSSAELKRHMDDIENIGSMFRQYSGQYTGDKLGALKKALNDSGHGDMINPAWDSLNESDLQTTLKKTGEDIGDASTKFRSMFGLQDRKSDTAIKVAEIGAKSREAVATTRAEALKAIQRAKGSSDPKTLEAAMTGAMLHAQNATDPQEQAAFVKAAMAFQEQLQALAKLKALAPKEGGLDMGAATSMPTQTAPNMPPIVMPTPPAPKPQTAAPTAPAAPKGQRARVQGPDGKVYTVPVEQVEEAMKRGYAPIR